LAYYSKILFELKRSTLVGAVFM